MAKFEFSQPPESLSQAVHEAVGAASVCWENMSGTGVFDDTRAREVAQGLLDYINENYAPRVTSSTDVLAGDLFWYSEWLDGEDLIVEPLRSDLRSHEELVKEFLTLDEQGKAGRSVPRGERP